jgi:hypothetical protein
MGTTASLNLLRLAGARIRASSELDLDRLTETFAGRVSKEWQIEEPWQGVVPRKEGRF